MAWSIEEKGRIKLFRELAKGIPVRIVRANAGYYIYRKDNKALIFFNREPQLTGAFISGLSAGKRIYEQ